jgi:hypothetical protein
VGRLDHGLGPARWRRLRAQDCQWLGLELSWRLAARQRLLSGTTWLVVPLQDGWRLN